MLQKIVVEDVIYTNKFYLMKKRKKNYYFTFGHTHFDINGVNLRNCWVRVRDYDYWDARSLFIEKFALVYLPESDKWAYQYEEKDFEPILFPDKEYILITERKKQNVL